MMDVSQYLDVFIEESKEHLQTLNESLLNIEKDPENLGEINAIFRAAHTLKGMSATMCFNRMSQLTHAMEDVLDGIRNNKLRAGEAIIDLLFKCLDALEKSIIAIADTAQEGEDDFSELIEKLEKFASQNAFQIESLPKPDNKEKIAEDGRQENEIPEPATVSDMDQYERSVIKTALDMNMNVYKIHIVLDAGCLLKAARAYIIFKTLEEHGEIIKSEPSAEDIENEKFDNSFSITLISNEDKDFIARLLDNIPEIHKITITEIKDGNLLENGTATKINDFIDNISRGRTESVQNANGHLKLTKTVRVDIEKLDLLLNLVSELIIQKTRLDEILNSDRAQSYSETLEYLERITTNLHDAVMKVRMVPVESVFNRFPRLIRDLSRELNKEINLVMSGQDTELDRTVIDEIGEPLIHLLRNSADHGIEPVEERIKSGKDRAGHIYLTARHDGNNVVIEVRDDGRGIDLEKVRKTAVERGIITEEESVNYGKNELIELLFLPSFSTAEKITDVSGRGVGLDAVKAKIESLGGSIEIDTEPGAGSRFTIRLPLTLAIIRALLVRIGNEKYAIPLSSVNRIVKIEHSQVKDTYNQKVFILQDKIIPVIWLNEILELDIPENQTDVLTVVVIQRGERLTGLVVDSYIGQQEVVIKSLGKYLSGIKEIAGATILGDGNVALILDPNRLA